MLDVYLSYLAVENAKTYVFGLVVSSLTSIILRRRNVSSTKAGGALALVTAGLSLPDLVYDAPIGLPGLFAGVTTGWYITYNFPASLKTS